MRLSRLPLAVVGFLAIVACEGKLAPPPASTEDDAGSPSSGPDSSAASTTLAGDGGPESSSEGGPSVPCTTLHANPAFLAGPPQVLAKIPVPAGVAVDAQYAYVASYEIGPVYRVALADGTITQLDPVSATTIATNSTSVFTVSPSGGNAPQGLVVSCAKAGCGGDATTLASGQSAVWGVAADDANVYWTNQGGSAAGVWKAPVAGGAPTSLSSAGAADAIVVGDGRVFYTGMDSAGTGSEGLDSVPIAGGAPTELVPPPPSGSVSGLAVDCQNVYYATTDGTVGKVPLSGGPPVVLATGALVGFQLAADGINLYFPIEDAIAYVPVGGGPVQVIPGTSASNGIAVDQDWVYWTTGSGELMRAGKLVPQGG